MRDGVCNKRPMDRGRLKGGSDSVRWMLQGVLLLLVDAWELAREIA